MSRDITNTTSVFMFKDDFVDLIVAHENATQKKKRFVGFYIYLDNIVSQSLPFQY